MTLGDENVMTVTCITYSPGLSSATTEVGEMRRMWETSQATFLSCLAAS
jgi:hypothetical protein